MIFLSQLSMQRENDLTRRFSEVWMILGADYMPLMRLSEGKS
jgi:hypothetical protein